MQDTSVEVHSKLKESSQQQADAISSRNEQESAFLQLPGEIRNYIYGYVLGGNRFILDQPDVSVPKATAVLCPDNVQPACELLGLTEVCRQTRSESAPMVFFLNKFTLDNDPEPKSVTFANILGASQRNLIQHVVIDACHFECLLDSVDAALENFQGLKRVTVVASWMGVETEETAYAHIKTIVEKRAGKDLEVFLQDNVVNRSD
ncbi:hypothetical protein P153DRAFT_354070 [Dothidotthia symphoricarpi CBS 119687]|uniref:Uncharacterized protein n=1 Tax=Dothidotthia symphoricarpi CBS 119687 TaxID=1392245 RepID=A0A6A6AN47_9PLEO|nr:uncharacterized protein P153DRAFT_354070 [Dothidotthia symphoricarpi CBS 119687]KAF2132568.1 hypothetical protein P153DRAFT_354070 [Dothidotthia symphoricarpi CBS 119687]